MAVQLKDPWIVTVLWLLFSATTTCGGIAIVDPNASTGGGGAGSATSSTTTSSTTTSSTTTSSTTTSSTTTSSTTTTTVGCDVGDCNACLAGECLAELCGTAIDACRGDADCAGLGACVDGCPGDPGPCLQQCKQSYPSGVPLLFAMYDCMHCQACFEDCEPMTCPYQF